MKILKGKIDWMEGYQNDPRLCLLVDQIPEQKDLRYRQAGPFYFAEDDGYVSYFYYDGPGDGFGGARIGITLIDGKTLTLIGPWSSSCSVMNRMGFGPCIDVYLTIDEEAWDKGHMFHVASVMIDLIEKSKHIIDISRPEIEGIITLVEKNGSFRVVVTKSDGTIYEKGNRDADRNRT